MKKCPKCSKSYDDTWGVCLNCSVVLIPDSEITSNSSPSQSAPKPSAEITTKESGFKERPLFMKLALVTWALFWRSVIIATAGVTLFNFVLVLCFRLTQLDIPTPSLSWGVWDILIFAPLYLFLFEWAANVIAPKFYNFESVKFLGLGLYLRFLVLYGLIIFLNGLTGVLNGLPLVTLDVFAGLLLGFWATAYFEKKKKEALKYEKECKPSETPACLMRKALFFVPGLYFVLVLIMALSFTVGAGIIIAMLMAPRIYPFILIMIGLGVVLTVIAVFNALGKILFPPASKVTAVVIDPKKYPHFNSMLKELAEKTRTKMPNHVVVSYDGEFSVQKNKLIVLGGSQVKGRILTISAPLLRFLNVTEMKAILAHEFGHFSGHDTTFSSVVQPIYSGSLEALKSITIKNDSDSINWMALPNILPGVILSKYIEGFHKINMRISRGREFRSDLVAIQITGKEAFETGLQKVMLISRVLNHVLSNPEEVKNSFNFTSINMYGELASISEKDTALITKAKQALDEEDSKPEDIYDSHPSYRARMMNIASSPSGEIDNRLAIELFDAPETWEMPLTKHIQSILKIIEDKKSARYTVILSNLKLMKEHKEFLSDLPKFVDCSESEIQEICSNDVLRVGSLNEDQAVLIIKHFKKFTEKPYGLLKITYEQENVQKDQPVEA